MESPTPKPKPTASPTPIPTPGGLKPTLRQLMILVLWSALMIVLTRSEVDRSAIHGKDFATACLDSLWILGFSPNFLSGLLLLDRPGPVRDWYCHACSFTSVVTFSTCLAIEVPASWWLTGHLSGFQLATPLLAVGGFVASGWMWRMQAPRRCPACGRVAVIRLLKGVEADRPEDGWCAACGARFHRRKAGPWTPGESPSPHAP